MKRTLAITAAVMLLSLPLAGCGNVSDGYGATESGTTATDTMHNDGSGYNTGTYSGATANTDTANGGLGSVTGAVNRAYGYNGGYTAYNNAGYRSVVDYSDAASVHRAAKAGDNYARMLENGRVHDTDGFILDGENASWSTVD
ncbi:MAG: hypothetical protein J5449_10745 [Oscillospiraceae bacterium]|nr:hypothetical protein [Oscillospiraceae bacterium]